MGFLHNPYMLDTGRYICAVIILGLVPVMGCAQEEPKEPDATETPEAAPEVPEVRASLLHASAWCVIRAKSKPRENEPEEPSDPDVDTQADSDDGDPDSFTGCDLGVALSLYRVRRLAWVVVLGSKSLGTGLAWVVSRPSVPGPVIAIAIGLVAQYDSGGVYVGEVYPAIGATLSFGRATEGTIP